MFTSKYGGLMAGPHFRKFPCEFINQSADSGSSSGTHQGARKGRGPHSSARRRFSGSFGLPSFPSLISRTGPENPRRPAPRTSPERRSRGDKFPLGPVRSAFEAREQPLSDGPSTGAQTRLAPPSRPRREASCRGLKDQPAASAAPGVEAPLARKTHTRRRIRDRRVCPGSIGDAADSGLADFLDDGFVFTTA